MKVNVKPPTHVTITYKIWDLQTSGCVKLDKNNIRMYTYYIQSLKMLYPPLKMRLSIYPSVRLSVHLSVRLYIHPSVSASFPLSAGSIFNQFSSNLL